MVCLLKAEHKNTHQFLDACNGLHRIVVFWFLGLEMGAGGGGGVGGSIYVYMYIYIYITYIYVHIVLVEKEMYRVHKTCGFNTWVITKIQLTFSEVYIQGIGKLIWRDTLHNFNDITLVFACSLTSPLSRAHGARCPLASPFFAAQRKNSGPSNRLFVAEP